MRRKTWTGETFGHLVVESEPVSEWHERWKKWIRHIECRCVCGSVKRYSTEALSSGHTRSCGCMRIEAMRKSRLLPKGEASLRTAFVEYKKSAKRRKLSFTITLQLFRELTSMECHYCGSPPRPSNYKHAGGAHLGNGLDRVDNSRGYDPDNVRPCCAACNRMKGILGEFEFLSRCIRVARHTVEKRAGAKQAQVSLAG